MLCKQWPIFHAVSIEFRNGREGSHWRVWLVTVLLLLLLVLTLRLRSNFCGIKSFPFSFSKLHGP
jgi:uncharacterized integral membrane protein